MPCRCHDFDRQVMERLGREADGWTRQKAERELGAKLAAVERGMRKPRTDVRQLATEFVEVALAAKPRKKSTLIDCKATIRNHLRPAFGPDDLGALSSTSYPDAAQLAEARVFGAQGLAG